MVHFQRRATVGQVSIERVFAQVRGALPKDIDCRVQVCPTYSRGVVRRAVNVYSASRSGAEVNHITGDVHYLAAGLDGRRTLLTIHDCATLERLRGLKRTVFRWLWFSMPVRRVAMVTVISESTRRELLRHTNCPPSKIRVLHDCVGGEFTFAPKRLNEAEPVILLVGTGSNKNLQRALPALAGLRCRLLVIGRLSQEQLELLRQCGLAYNNLPQATEAELLQAYRDCDLVLFASIYEGFGLPIIEANATGRPVVTSDLFSMPEVAGAAACVVDPFDAAAIRAGVNRVLSDASYRQALIEAGLENVRRFTTRKIAEEYAELYREIEGRTIRQSWGTK